MPVPVAISPLTLSRFVSTLTRQGRQETEFWRQYNTIDGLAEGDGDAELSALIAAFWRSHWFRIAAPTAAALGRAHNLRRPEWSVRPPPRLELNDEIREELRALYLSVGPRVQRAWYAFESDRVLKQLALLSDPERGMLNPLVDLLRAKTAA